MNLAKFEMMTRLLQTTLIADGTLMIFSNLSHPVPPDYIIVMMFTINAFTLCILLIIWKSNIKD